MTRYSIDLHNGSHYMTGITSFGANDDDAAKVHAIRALSSMMRDCVQETGCSSYIASVRDKRGITLFHINLSLDCSWPN